MRMIPHPVMVGFVNGLGIVIGLAQFNSFKVQDNSDDSHRRLEVSGSAYLHILLHSTLHLPSVNL